MTMHVIVGHINSKYVAYLVASMAKLTLKEGQEQFQELLSKVRPVDVAPFLQWVEDSFSIGKKDDGDGDDAEKPKLVRDAAMQIKTIAEHLRLKLPLEATMGSENIKFPTIGYDSECNATNTIHLDCFLYDEDAVEELVEEGKISRNYCLSCSSKDTKPLTFISHSLGPEQMEFMFTELVPLTSQKQNFHVVDIGSRLGAVIYSANAYSGGRCKVTGIELNEDLSKLQNEVIKEFSLENISVVCSDVRNQGDLLKTADLVVMNNVFSFFMPPVEQASCWTLVKESLRPGCLIIHNPSIAEVTAHLELPFEVEDWLEQIKTTPNCVHFAKDNETLFEDCQNLTFYKVKKQD